MRVVMVFTDFFLIFRNPNFLFFIFETCRITHSNLFTESVKLYRRNVSANTVLLQYAAFMRNSQPVLEI
jgi:hypothetical protein